MPQLPAPSTVTTEDESLDDAVIGTLFVHQADRLGRDLPRGRVLRWYAPLAAMTIAPLRSPTYALACALALACGDAETKPLTTPDPAPKHEPTGPTDPLTELGLEALRPRPHLSWPTLIPHITSTFGWRINPMTGAGNKLHRGLDLRGKTGDPVLSIGGGRIQFAGHDRFLGTCAIVDHGGGLTSWYGHMSDLLVYEGMSVERGAAIGLVGSTGRSQAAHLHLSVKIGDTSIDPLMVLGAPAYAYPALLSPVIEEPAPVDAASDPNAVLPEPNTPSADDPSSAPASPSSTPSVGMDPATAPRTNAPSAASVAPTI
ncbi:MAG TPA: M23 family metallopeptidase [Nannocystis exedens]|nr:M23 family metallopeptidase [Nannocystis exedens]